MAPLGRQEDSLLLCVDIQERLLESMVEPARGRMLENTKHLIKVAQLLEMPVFYTEQYPQVLGQTQTDIQAALPNDAKQFAKQSFSCCGEAEFMTQLRATHKRQIVITGMETHICVMQSALDLVDAGYEVFVVDDAVCSQRMAHWKSALHRMRLAGVSVAPTESIMFEWIRNADHPHFKTVSALLG